MMKWVFVTAGMIAAICELYATRRPWHWMASTVTLGVGLP
jgi:hypothetical protein